MELLKKPISIGELGYNLARAFGAKVTSQALALNQVLIGAVIAELYNIEKSLKPSQKDLRWKAK